ncbi:MAG: alpha-amylase family glycosyl hydrolase [Gemmatimonadales bacterium]
MNIPRSLGLACLALSASEALVAQPAPQWTQGATCYEVFVRSFRDSDGDGIGDLSGLIGSLDYLNDGNPRTTRDLGVRCLWLMPVMASPSYHGYDVTDYYQVNPQYGTNADFRRLVAEAHRRGIRVLVDLVVNHVSSEHPAFRAALTDPTSPFRSWFRFAPAKGPRNRWGGDNWHQSSVRDEYYYGFFSSRMPDLNYEEPQVLAEMERVITFWLIEMGVDGFRLDAVKFLVEEGARADDTPGTHRVLARLAEHTRRVKRDAVTIGEVWDSIGAVLPYYPDQLDGYFAFEVADSLIAAVGRGSAGAVLAPVLRLQDALPPWRWSPFLRNHDQPRTRTELAGNWQKARLAAVLLLTLPGLPFVYYGEEVGMTGTKPDERIRTPMAWTRAGPHGGFTRGTPWQPLAGDSLEANVETQDGDSRSLLSLYRRLVHLRASMRGLASGRLLPLTASHPEVVSFIRKEGASVVMVVVNLSNEPLARVMLDSGVQALPQGRFRPRDMLSGVRVASITVGIDGRLRGYSPLPVLAPETAWIFELERFMRVSPD